MKPWWALALVVGCAPPTQRFAWVGPPGLRASVSAKADVAFTPRERVIIAAAADYLEQEVRVQYRISFDLEVGASALEANQIWRPPLDAVVVTRLDQEHGGAGKVYGGTQQSWPFRVWLMPARTPATWLFAHVVEHELLHAIGCEHVTDDRSVMYEFTTPGQFESLRLTDVDRQEVDRALRALAR